jgi:MarR family transcriptional regulator, 2-MHQ and catechol-resistance regulon repressor
LGGITIFAQNFLLLKPVTMIMGIEKDIQQTKFRNPHQKAAINLIYTIGWVRDKMKTFFDTEDITAQQFNILRILRGSFPQPLSTLQIRERMLEKMSDTSRIVDRLIAKGLVKKITCKSDRRLVDVIITDKGKKLLERLDLRQEEMDQIFGNISEQDANILSDLLDKIRDGNE